MSINWTRIFLLGYEEGLTFYDRVFDACIKAGIEPLVTMSHYVTPVGLTNRWNAWCDRRPKGTGRPGWKYVLRCCQSISEGK
ncbi:MAG: family 1 glycosylhydrolase [Bulleidia sp.]